MYLVSLALNIVVLIPVLLMLRADGPAAALAWGADTTARRILAAIYAAILAASIFLLVLRLQGRAVEAWIQALLGVQIAYKLLSAPLAGLKNPVVLSNLGIAIVHAFTLTVTSSPPTA